MEFNPEDIARGLVSSPEDEQFDNLQLANLGSHLAVERVIDILGLLRRIVPDLLQLMPRQVKARAGGGGRGPCTGTGSSGCGRSSGTRGRRNPRRRWPR